MHADPPALVPVREESSALAIADEVGLEPAGEPVLTCRGDEPVGNEHEGAVGERDSFGSPEVLVQDRPEAQLGCKHLHGLKPDSFATHPKVAAFEAGLQGGPSALASAA